MTNPEYQRTQEPEFFITRKGERVIINLTYDSILRLSQKYGGQITMRDLIDNELAEIRQAQRN